MRSTRSLPEQAARSVANSNPVAAGVSGDLRIIERSPSSRNRRTRPSASERGNSAWAALPRSFRLPLSHRDHEVACPDDRAKPTRCRRHNRDRPPPVPCGGTGRAIERVGRWTARPQAEQSRGSVDTGRGRRDQFGRAPVSRYRRVAVAASHLGTQARMTLAATPCRWGRKVALLSASKVKVPPGLMA
jgi:hypothetical protein